jgi:hypothetical protein
MYACVPSMEDLIYAWKCSKDKRKGVRGEVEEYMRCKTRGDESRGEETKKS